MTSQARIRFLSPEEYLASELGSHVRHEYIAGRVFAMVGASQRHNLIAGNIHFALRSHLRGGPCRAFISEMKVRIGSADSFYYPDVVVSCAPDDKEPYYLTQPCLIAEVLSPATEAIDRREKPLAYQQLPSLKEYLLVSQEQPKVELYRRRDEDEWWLEAYEAGETILLESLNRALPLAVVYEDLSATSP
ncbi:Uma2 family endonuclease [Nitrosococcus wardiae]|uniref:Uma2 family endonuclease n=2 Tax=Nitrosococcus wardiae TaxID=1814290 RepID=A0A4P7C697_9GAMM|nr:Uma2 family endonuclease [Nitrosococcus wardiae]